MSERDIARLEKSFERLTNKVDVLSTNIAETNVKLAEMRGERKGVNWLIGVISAAGGMGGLKLIETVFFG